MVEEYKGEGSGKKGPLVVVTTTSVLDFCVTLEKKLPFCKDIYKSKE